MHRLFGRKKQEAPAPPPVDVAAHAAKFDQKIPELDARINAIDKELYKFKAQINAARSPQQKQQLTQQATQLLRQKKIYHQQRMSYGNRQFNQQQIGFALDAAKDARQEHLVLQELARQLKDETGKVDVEAMEDMHLDIEDYLEDAEEINQVLSREYNVGPTVNMDELNAEFASLDSELDALPDVLPGNTNANYDATGVGTATGAGNNGYQQQDADLAGFGAGGSSATPAWMMPAVPASSGQNNYVPTAAPAAVRQPAAMSTGGGGGGGPGAYR